MILGTTCREEMSLCNPEAGFPCRGMISFVFWPSLALLRAPAPLPVPPPPSVPAGAQGCARRAQHFINPRIYSSWCGFQSRNQSNAADIHHCPPAFTPAPSAWLRAVLLPAHAAKRTKKRSDSPQLSQETTSFGAKAELSWIGLKTQRIDCREAPESSQES